MKSITSALQLHLRGNLTTLCTCWHIARKDGVVKAYTSAQHDLALDGITYKAINGSQPSAVESTGTLAVGNLEIDGLLNAGEMEGPDLAAGRYDGASVSVFIVNRKDLSQGRLSLRKGTIGQVTWEQGKFTCEIRGLEQALEQSVVELTSKTCRASLGDERCRKDLAALTYTSALSNIQDNRIVAASLPGFYTDYRYGTLKFLTGANAGLSMEIKDGTDGGVDPLNASHRYSNLALLLPMPFIINQGDTATITQGCDRTRARCVHFANIANFRGEPDIPEIAAISNPHL